MEFMRTSVHNFLWQWSIVVFLEKMRILHQHRERRASFYFHILWRLLRNQLLIPCHVVSWRHARWKQWHSMILGRHSIFNWNDKVDVDTLQNGRSSADSSVMMPQTSVVYAYNDMVFANRLPIPWPVWSRFQSRINITKTGTLSKYRAGSVMTWCHDLNPVNIRFMFNLGHSIAECFQVTIGGKFANTIGTLNSE